MRSSYQESQQLLKKQQFESQEISIRGSDKLAQISKKIKKKQSIKDQYTFLIGKNSNQLKLWIAKVFSFEDLNLEMKESEKNKFSKKKLKNQKSLELSQFERREAYHLIFAKRLNSFRILIFYINTTTVSTDQENKDSKKGEQLNVKISRETGEIVAMANNLTDMGYLAQQVLSRLTNVEQIYIHFADDWNLDLIQQLLKLKCHLLIFTYNFTEKNQSIFYEDLSCKLVGEQQTRDKRTLMLFQAGHPDNLAKSKIILNSLSNAEKINSELKSLHKQISSIYSFTLWFSQRMYEIHQLEIRELHNNQLIMKVYSLYFNYLNKCLQELLDLQDLQQISLIMDQLCMELQKVVCSLQIDNKVSKQEDILNQNIKEHALKMTRPHYTPCMKCQKIKTRYECLGCKAIYHKVSPICNKCFKETHIKTDKQQQFIFSPMAMFIMRETARLKKCKEEHQKMQQFQRMSSQLKEYKSKLTSVKNEVDIEEKQMLKPEHSQPKKQADVEQKQELKPKQTNIIVRGGSGLKDQQNMAQQQ